MKDITVKSPYDNVTVPAPSDEVLDNTEYNDRRVELQGAVTDTNQALSAADTGQLSKAMSANGVAAQSMLDSGGVNTVVLTPVTGANGLRLATPVAPDYTLLNGAIFNFKANNTNSGNTTVNIGQTAGTLIGALSLFLGDGTSQAPAGTVVAGNWYNVRYDPALDGGSGAFEILGTGSVVNGLSENVLTKFFTGSLDGDTITTIAHGIADYTKILSVTATLENVSGSFFRCSGFGAGDQGATGRFDLEYNASDISLNDVGTLYQGNRYRIRMDYIA